MIETVRKAFHLDASWPDSVDLPSSYYDVDPSVTDLKMLSSIQATKERLSALRKELKLNQKEFAKLTGISVANIEAVEFEKRKLTMRMAKRIEDSCGIGTEWLLHGDEDAKYHPCGQRMTSFLKKHPEARKIMWEMMVHMARIKGQGCSINRPACGKRWPSSPGHLDEIILVFQ